MSDKTENTLRYTCCTVSCYILYNAIIQRYRRAHRRRRRRRRRSSRPRRRSSSHSRNRRRRRFRGNAAAF